MEVSKWLFSPRAIAAVKRKLHNCISRNSATSLRQLEQKPEIVSNWISRYSNGFNMEIKDPRSNKISGHFFNSRDAFELENVILEPLQSSIYSQNGRLVKESTIWPAAHYFDSFPWTFKKVQSFSTIENGIAISSNSYYHWLIEDLPSTLFLSKLFPETTLICYSDAPRYVEDLLKTLPNPVLKSSKPMLVAKLKMVEKSEDYGWPSPADIEVLKGHGPINSRIKSHADTKIYISRENARRSPSNEFQIAQYFLSKGFTKVVLENFNLLEQIEIISGAKVIAGIHGAGLTNMVWMNTGGAVIDIANVSYWTECYHRLAEICHQSYIPFVYEGPILGEVPIPSLDDLISTFDFGRESK